MEVWKVVPSQPDLLVHNPNHFYQGFFNPYHVYTNSYNAPAGATYKVIIYHINAAGGWEVIDARWEFH